MAQGQQPILILPQGTSRYVGKEAQRINILAGKVLAETVRTTLGPKGMDKMLVDSLGDIVITNDGVTILREMDISHPAAKMLVEVAKTQEDEVGDGTTTAVIIAGELLKEAEKLIEMGVHPTIIAVGYRQAALRAQEILEDISIKASDRDTLMKVAVTAMTGKGSERAKEKLAELVVDAVMQVEEDGEIDRDNINIQRIQGASVNESRIVNGIVIDKARADTSMPKRVENARIALLKYPIEVKDLETDAKIRLTDPSQMQAFIEQEEQMIRDMVDKIKSSGANVVFCQKGIDDLALHYLSREGILALKRVKKSDIKRIEKATGARLVTNIEDLTEDDLGEAGVVYEKKIFDDVLTFVENCKDPKAISIILRGSTKHVAEEMERALEDAIGVVASTIEDGEVVAGGGAPEVEIARKLREYADTISGREQLAVSAFADALEIVPKTLAENAGLDSIDVLVDLRAAHEESPYMGLDVFEGSVVDMKEEGVLEPQRVKKQAIQSAAEAAEMILRIDDMIAAKGFDVSSKDEEDMEGMGGMGGMPPMM
ncbi:TCP-1/cpn60 chaperonin family protein [Methanothermobacter marburgensis]|uniref:Thermosome, subunit alpha (Chaperonin subunit) n=1 Tax=Methanothermobacter marburgensis (strain ATCC BAA-927 / DSM 2133 / JCM 14651 / NBRC 100331 / OCM 82 / Marburg) TaxID=79929 RepID=D9PVL4_METTM|nr:thermosome subunit alpha [Methanothermobacter marburgensis]ADL58262.1 thermosome, subunit alpha (chaperonin subunit) [Methanothermobacter marburgensis str. Marburg]WBF10425.1 TCP-1/cpn60 chaperonin family protein [Methanothermobacter marburgensis]